jgi:hypothetical protein
LREAYSKGSQGKVHANTVEEEFAKPLPDLNWIHDQIASGWKGGANACSLVNSSGQTLVHIMAMIGSAKVGVFEG